MIKKMEFFLFVFLVLFIPHLLFSQNITKITIPFFPGTSKSDVLEERIAKEKSAIENSNHYLYLLQYLAAKNEDPTLSSLKNGYKELTNYRYLGEKRCDEIKNDKVKDICFAYSRGKCDTLNSPSAEVCKAFVNDDAPALIDLLVKPPFNISSKDRANKVLSIIFGFKYHDVNSCLRFSKNLDLISKLGCNILFSTNAEDYIDRIVRYIAISNIAKKDNDLSLCEMINNADIKKFCKDPRKENIDDIWK